MFFIQECLKRELGKQITVLDDTSIFSGLSCLEKCIGDLQVHRRLHLNDMF